MARKRLPGHLHKGCGMRKSNASFSGKDCAAHICKVCSRLSLEQQTEQMTLRRLENLLPRRLTENEMTWLKDRTHNHRPEVKALACMVYAEGFPHLVRNQKKQELSIRTLELSVDGEICDPHGDLMYIKESYQIGRTPPAIVCIQQGTTRQKIVSPPKILAKPLKWTVHTLEIYWWGEDYCSLANIELEDRKSSVVCSCGILQQRESGYKLGGHFS